MVDVPTCGSKKGAICRKISLQCPIVNVPFQSILPCTTAGVASLLTRLPSSFGDTREPSFLFVVSRIKSVAPSLLPDKFPFVSPNLITLPTHQRLDLVLKQVNGFQTPKPTKITIRSIFCRYEYMVFNVSNEKDWMHRP
jgi:hypothetical protein